MPRRDGVVFLLGTAIRHLFLRDCSKLVVSGDRPIPGTAQARRPATDARSGGRQEELGTACEGVAYTDFRVLCKAAAAIAGAVNEGSGDDPAGNAERRGRRRADQ